MDLTTIVIIVLCLLALLIILLSVSAFVLIDLLSGFCNDFRFVRNVLCGIKDLKEEG